MYAAPDALLDDGLLDILWVERTSKLRFMTKVLPRIFNGSYVKLPEVGFERAAEVRISADRPFAVYADGDHLTDLPASLRVLPAALDVIAPPGPLAGPPT
jgi:diacylglycerol kinase family enzyme